IAEGDLGAAGAWPASARVQAMVAAATPDLVLGLGDLAYADLTGAAAMHRHFEGVRRWSERAAYMPAWGNHDWQRDEGDRAGGAGGRRGRRRRGARAPQGALGAAERRRRRGRAGRAGVLRRRLVLVRLRRRPLHRLPRAV